MLPKISKNAVPISVLPPEILQGNKNTIIVSLTMTANVRLLLDLKRPPDENIKSKLKEITEVTIREIKDYHGTGKTYVS